PLAALRLVHAVEREVETGARLHRACSRLVGLGFGLQEEIRRLQRRQTAAAGAVLLPFGHLLRRFRGRQLLLRFRRETLRGGPQTRDASLFRTGVLLRARLGFQVLHLEDQLVRIVGHARSIHLLISVACCGSPAQSLRNRNRGLGPWESTERRSPPRLRARRAAQRRSTRAGPSPVPPA